MNLSEHELFRLLFPESIWDYFAITRVAKTDTVYQVYLEEDKEILREYQGQNYICHGFNDEQIIHDLPLCGKSFDLLVKRRR